MVLLALIVKKIILHFVDLFHRDFTLGPQRSFVLKVIVWMSRMRAVSFPSGAIFYAVRGSMKKKNSVKFTKHNDFSQTANLGL